MIKRLVAAGVTATGIAVASATMAAPAHADVVCTPDTFFILYAGGTPTSECTEGHDVTYDMPSVGVDLIRSGDHRGYLVRADNGTHVGFKKYQEKYFGPAGIVFSQIHFD
ncbi:hypothetical protein [Actinoallomurus iriomotensis]|jgi:hypothetical protein|uniref:Streptomyces killer toxin-like beta/gamma crystallin domain-containing protein n=1 Tax=Actinoallomurus iriomotensis TaxID=478107 RepID=A0A9W6RDC9_9ACTN|nr:hypothetical protein [Actinoallomurus iriomotensis]GLY73721.1 hypothetical protein Airi01_019880 [Actinoallomurus iriomotensis]GLY90306.1 hypothetical protein Airi02_082350 [Actinoallomurus iriomotensis]